MTGILKIFLQIPTMALLLQIISHVAHSVWIHADDKSYKLIKIVYACGKWMVDDQNKILLAWIPLSFYLNDMRSWLYYYLVFSSFLLDIHVSIFWVVLLWHTIFSLLFTMGHASLACHLSSLFFFFLNIAHASFEGLYGERERLLSLSFILWNVWNGIGNF